MHSEMELQEKIIQDARPCSFIRGGGGSNFVLEIYCADTLACVILRADEAQAADFSWVKGDSVETPKNSERRKNCTRSILIPNRTMDGWHTSNESEWRGMEVWV